MMMQEAARPENTLGTDDLTQTEAALQGEKLPRGILTYMRRSNPLSTSQRDALIHQQHRLADANTTDLRALFTNPAQPLTVEIGFGMGQSLVQMAASEPDRNFLGIEVHIPGIAQCLHDAAQAGITNLRLMEADALAVLQRVPDDHIDRVQLFFPDPWQKKRHHKRRFVTPERMALVIAKLAPDGWFHAATDWAPYAEWMLEVLESLPALRNVYGVDQYAPRPEWRPLTKFERRGEAAGHGVWDLIYQKVEEPISP